MIFKQLMTLLFVAFSILNPQYALAQKQIEREYLHTDTQADRVSESVLTAINKEQEAVQDILNQIKYSNKRHDELLIYVPESVAIFAISATGWAIDRHLSKYSEIRTVRSASTILAGVGIEFLKASVVVVGLLALSGGTYVVYKIKNEREKVYELTQKLEMHLARLNVLKEVIAESKK